MNRQVERIISHVNLPARTRVEYPDNQEMRPVWAFDLGVLLKRPNDLQKRVDQFKLVHLIRDDIDRQLKEKGKPVTVTELHKLFESPTRRPLVIAAEHFPENWHTLQAFKCEAAAYAIVCAAIKEGKIVDNNELIPNWLREWAITSS